VETAQPESMALTPGVLASGPHPAPPEQHLAQAMATADQILVGSSRIHRCRA
jgi:hypothetical protein